MTKTKKKTPILKKIKKYYYDSFIAFKPKQELKVSEWAERHRNLDFKTSAIAGLWQNSITPYLVEIMDTMNDPEVEETVFVKPTQVGGTEALLNRLGYIISEEPAPTMIVYPSDELARSTSKNRITPMIELSDSVNKHYKPNSSENMELQFDNMYCSLTGANSPASLSSKPIKYLFLDEIDKFPIATKLEADPLSLARERTKTFINRKIYMCSTPTLRRGHIWRAKEQCDIEKHYFIPCPHCGKYIELKFKNIKFPSAEEVKLTDNDRSELAIYVCQECGHTINDIEKNRAMQYGEWRIVRENKKSQTKVAYWINTLYSPFVKFRDIVKKFLESKEDPDLLHNFTNSWLAEPWEETKLKTSVDVVLERQTECEMWQLPEWTKLITAGVDVQRNSLYYVIRAWGDYLTSQDIAHGQVSSFSDIEKVMNIEFKKKDGTAMQVELCLVDSGDQTDDVYDFCADHNEWATACKGVANSLSHYRLSQINKLGSKAQGLNLILVDGGKYKDLIASRLMKPNGIGSFMTYKDCDLEYANQITSECKVTERKNGQIYSKWVPKTEHADNHYLDANVYATCAADICGVRNLYLQNVIETQKDQSIIEIENKEKEEWIKNNQDWV